MYNYKIQACIGPSIDQVERCTTVLDTGAGPNLVKSSLLTTETLKTMKHDQQIVNLAGAGGHRLKPLGIVTLTVKVGSNITRQPFVVVDALGADAILGTTYIDEHIEFLWIRRRAVIFPNGEHFPIEKRPGMLKPCLLYTSDAADD